jgi:hypothetical protein
MRTLISSATLAVLAMWPPAAACAEDASRLIAAMMGETPLVEDLRALTDEIGGRPTGSEANRRSIEWALGRFREAGVAARIEPFEMPALWLERSATASIEGDLDIAVRVAAMPFSTDTGGARMSAPLVDGGRGTAGDFERLGDSARGAFVLIETDELEDIPGLFREYAEAAAIEERAFAAGVAGVVYMGSRPRDVLHRHNASKRTKNDRPMLVMERGSAQRTMRLLERGKSLQLSVELDLESGGAYESYNVVGEIRGSQDPEEIVVIGAHLDSWGIGTGALDNGCNVALIIDLARQMKRLGMTPRRTIRFVLFNGEELGLNGSRGYTETHVDELDQHVMASSFDIGSGRITGFFTNGREELVEFLEAALEPVNGLGPFDNPNIPIVGTDNFDFMMQGVANLVANQESANYGPNYHAGTDTFDKVDLEQLRLNAAVAAAVTWSFAQRDIDWERHRRKEIQRLVDNTDLGDQMRTFGMFEDWQKRRRGRRD